MIAVVVVKPDAAVPDLAGVVAHCDGKLARYKQPREVHVVDALPRNATGKVQKDVLRLRFAGTTSSVTR